MRKIHFKIIAMEKSAIAMEKCAKEEQTPGQPLLPCPIPVPTGRGDYRLPHEIAAAILTAAYELVDKKLAWEQEAR